MIMDTYMFLIPVVAIIIICLMVLYARYVGRKSRGRYAAAAMRFIEKDYPEIDIRDKRYLSTRVDYNIISRHVPVLVVYNSHELHLVPIHALAIPPFYNIRHNDHHAKDMEHLMMVDVKAIVLDRRGRLHIQREEGNDIVLKVGENNVFHENQHEEAVHFLATLKKAADKVVL